MPDTLHTRVNFDPTTTLLVAITNDTTMLVQHPEKFDVVPHAWLLDNEVITAWRPDAASVTINIARAKEGTASVSHAAGAPLTALTELEEVGRLVGTTPQLPAGAQLTTPTLAAPAFSSSPTGDGVLQWAQVSIAPGAVATLRGTPVTLVAAPGAGKVLEFCGGLLVLDWTTPGFTEITYNLAVRYKDASGVQASDTIETTGFIDQVADTATSARPKIDAIAAKTANENQPLVLHNVGAAEFGGSGGSTLRVKVAYRVWSTGW